MQINPEDIYIRSYLLKKTERYLQIMNKKYKFNELGFFLVRDEIKTKHETLKLVLIIRFFMNWIQVLVPLIPIDNLTDDQKIAIYEYVLSLNNQLADTEFELDKQLGLIMISNETHLDAFFFDVFEEEYTAVVASVDIYKKIKESLLAKKKKQVEAV